MAGPVDDLLQHVEAVMDELEDATGASFTLSQIDSLIRAFEADLESDLEVAITISGEPFCLRKIVADDPSLLVFDGIDDEGNPRRLIQHHSQLSLALSALPKLGEKAFRLLH